MPRSSVRHKHIRLDQRKLTRAMSILDAKTETDALNRALDLVVAESGIDTPLRQARGRTRLQKLFR
ncbi:MAG: hypothetical protein HZA21_05015 [Nitrospirae bacterium]|nr:hypothetical protein [Nitrospirota bacterium]